MLVVCILVWGGGRGVGGAAAFRGGVDWDGGSCREARGSDTVGLNVVAGVSFSGARIAMMPGMYLVMVGVARMCTWSPPNSAHTSSSGTPDLAMSSSPTTGISAVS